MEETTRKVRMSPLVMLEMMTRDEYGNRLTVEWGEPDAEGFYEPTITVHFDDNIVVRELKRMKSAVNLMEGHILGLKGGISRERLENLIQARIEGRPWHPVINE